MEIRSDFCIFILCHEAPNDVKTVQTLEKAGNLYPWFIVVDSEDRELYNYEKIFGDKVLVFNKSWYANTTDVMDQSKSLSSPVFARNACFDMAKYLGYRFFLVLDDDVTNIRYKMKEKSLKITRITEVFTAFVSFLEKTPFTSIAFSQGGEHFNSKKKDKEWKKTISFKCMNSWFCQTDKPIKFMARINDDITTYINYFRKGHLFLTVMNILLDQYTTQQKDRGLTDVYRKLGTYQKSFYTTMVSPSCNRITYLPTKNGRIHHRIISRRIIPRIIREKYKKK